MKQNNNIETNPLLVASKAPFGAPRFDLLDNRFYMPAFEEAVRRAKAEIDAIVENPEPPDFINTVEALEYAGRQLSDIEGVFFNILEADSDVQMQEIAESVSPMLTDYQMYISLNARLFDRIREVYYNPGNIDSVQRKLLKDTYRSFIRNGAALSEGDKELFGRLSEELALSELKFGKNILAATKAFKLHITDSEELSGLPEYVVDAAAEAAAEDNEDGWIFNLDYPSYSPFMKFSSNRELRKKMYMAYSSRCIGGDSDNRPVITKIVGLRMKISRLLGYETYADYALEDRMVKTKAKVGEFISALMSPSLPKARKEVAELLAFARENGFEDEQLMPWDFSYWAEKYRQKKFNLDEEALKPYFRLENCIDAVFELAERLYGLRFVARTDVPSYHKDVKVYDVQDNDGEHLALFYADFFPRTSKRGGAWMTEFRGQYICGGTDFRPFVSIVTNFTKSTSKRPSLLTHDELTTLLHEFGHALHGILSKGRYPSMSGTEVARDFVELPSQLMENWAYEPEFLNTFAKHYETGEDIPSELIGRIVASRNYLSAYQQVRQLQFGIVDMAWHNLTEMPDEDVQDFEQEALASFRTLPTVKGTAVCPSFGHIFSGGYAAGYYSYKWAEVLEADAFSLFKEKGIFNAEVAGSFRKNILERGSSEDEEVLYCNFRGHDPLPEALLVKLGII